MKSYFILTCENQEKIAEGLYNFLEANDLIETANSFWNALTRQDVIKVINTNPDLMEWFSSMNLRVRDISWTIYSKQNKTSMHTDEPPVIAKINFPVLNTQDTYNIWFDKNKKEIDRTESTRPIVLRSNIPHTVEMGPNATYPRIQFSFCFYNEPLHLLG
jgi:hypothetical protein